jgi:diacylglycerol kinase family enzyme
MLRRVHIIANPIAGGGRAARRAPELVRCLAQRGIDAELSFTAAAGDAQRLAAGCSPGRQDAVLVVGGDGTLNAVLNGLPDPSLPLGVLPMGTANVLACELRLPRDPDRLAALVADGHTTRAAIGRANGRRFLLFVGAGLDGAMVERVEQVRRGTLGKWRWFAPVLHVVWRWPLQSLWVETDAGTRLDGVSEVLVTRVANYGGVMRMPVDLRIGESSFAVLCFRQRTRLGYLLAALRASFGRLRPGIDVEVLLARAVRIGASEPAPFQIDGDFGGRTPLDISLDETEARLVTPRL